MKEKSMGPKYELFERDKETGLYRIRALRDIPKHGVKVGDLGGWVESEANLSQEGDSWISDDVTVVGNAQVYTDALVACKARIGGRAQICGSARVGGRAQIRGDAHICGHALVSDKAIVDGKAVVGCNAMISGDAHVGGYAMIGGSIFIDGSARIESCDDFLCAGPIDSRGYFVTFYKTDSGIEACCGYLTGTINKFVDKMDKIHGDDQHKRVYRLLIELAKLRLGEVSLV